MAVKVVVAAAEAVGLFVGELVTGAATGEIEGNFVGELVTGESVVATGEREELFCGELVGESVAAIGEREGLFVGEVVATTG